MRELDPKSLPLYGYNLIEASAGTGKTYTITSIYLRLVMEEGLKPEEILVVTFTRAATEELRAKTRQRLLDAASLLDGTSGRPADETLEILVNQARTMAAGQGVGRDVDQEIARRLKQAILSLDQAAIYTIHGFCHRVLKEFSFDTGVQAGRLELADGKELRLEAAREFVRSRLQQLSVWQIEAVAEACATGLKGKRPSLPESISGLAGKLLSSPRAEAVPGLGLEEVLEEVRRWDRIKKALGESAREQVLEVLRDGVMTLAEEFLREAREGLGKKAAKSLETQLRGGRNIFEKHLNRFRKALDEVASNSFLGRKVLKPLEELAGLLGDGRRLFSWTASLLDSLVKADGTCGRRALEKAMTRRDVEAYRQALQEWMAAKDKTPSGPVAVAVEAVNLLEEACRMFGLEQRIQAAVAADAASFMEKWMAMAKAARGLLTHDDMLLLLRDALSTAEGAKTARILAARYKVALMDEFQDTDPVQWEIFQRIYPDPERSRLFLIGDPKQAIYGFRGADVFTYLRAKASVPEERCFSLGTNWRSAPELVDAVNAIFFDAGDLPFGIEGIEYTKVQGREENRVALAESRGGRHPAVEFWACRPDLLELAAGHGGSDERGSEVLDPVDLTAREIARLMALAAEGRLFLEASSGEEGQQRPLLPGDIAVLVRTNRQAQQVRDALFELGIPSIYHGPSSVFSTQEARETLYMLRAVLDPADRSTVSTALGTMALGYGADELYRLREDSVHWDQVVEAFFELRDQWFRQGVFPMLRSLFLRFGVPQRLLELKDGTRRLTNFRQLAELLADAEAGLSGPERLMLWLVEAMESPDEDAEEQRLRLETDENLVQIMTYHMSKGLEYPVVFLPFVEELPSDDLRLPAKIYHEDSERFVVLFSNAGTAAAGEEEHGSLYLSARTQVLSEEMRLLYVALTRAKYKMYLPVSKRGWTLLGLGEERVHGPVRPDAPFLTRVSGLSGVELRGFQELKELSDRPVPRPRAEEEQEQAMPGELPSRRPLVRQVWARCSFSSMSMEDGAVHSDGVWADLGQALEAEEAPGPFSFPRGPEAGNLVHRMLELCDFGADFSGLMGLAERLVEEAGFEPVWAPVLADIASCVLKAELLPGMRLSELQPEWMVREMEFHWPFGRELTRAFPALEELCTQGVMKGFVDLLFRYGERFYVLDYKTNWLGPSPGHYGTRAMETAMDQHGYWLQAAIYLKALDAMLEAGLAGYDRRRHLGGAVYLFVRGVCGGSPGEGVLHVPVEMLAGRFPWLFHGAGEPVTG